MITVRNAVSQTNDLHKSIHLALTEVLFSIDTKGRVYIMEYEDEKQIFVESIFPKAFGAAAQDSYLESQDTYTSLFEDQHKYNAIMSALADVVYREMRKSN